MEASTGNITGVAAIVLSVMTVIIGAINHKRIRSKCCGRRIEASLDIEQTTPPHVHPEPPSDPPDAITIRVPSGETKPA